MKKAAAICFATVLISSFSIFSANTDIRINSLGFLPDKAKRASISAACSTFSVVRSGSGTVAFSGKVSGPKSNSDTQEDLYTADFSALTEQGIFYLSVDGVGRSPDFPISGSAYDSAYYTAMRGLYLTRCGCAVSGTHNGISYRHAACHQADAYLDYLGAGHLISPSLRGWHDAGDYNKYTVNAGITVGMLLDAWTLFGPRIEKVNLDIPESGGALPDFLAETKWELDWVLTMQNGDGSVSHKVSTLDFGAFILPEAETADRFFCPWGSAATADFVAMAAMASRLYKTYDSAYAKRCLDAAVKSYNFLAANPADHSPDQSAFTTGAYGTSDPDDRLWAAAEMWETTGEQKYLTDFETRANSQVVKVDQDFDWGNVKNLGMFTYLLSGKTGKNVTLADAVKTALIKAADSIVIKRNAHGYGRGMTSYYWGCNGSVARQTMVLQIANTLSPKSDYLNAALDEIGYLFGRNTYCRSFVTGLGINPPMNPHDRRSGGDNIRDPWPGYLVGGGWPTAKSWIDSQANYQTNEIAINWQAALIFALAGFVNSPASRIQTAGDVHCRKDYATGAFSRSVNGLSRVSVPSGIFTVYDMLGKKVRVIRNDSPRIIDLNKMDLRQGVYIIKQVKP